MAKKHFSKHHSVVNKEVDTFLSGVDLDSLRDGRNASASEELTPEQKLRLETKAQGFVIPVWLKDPKVESSGKTKDRKG